MPAPAATTQPLTFAALLAQLQALTPEQLAMPARVWGAQTPYVGIERVEIAQNDYVCDEDNEVCEVDEAEMEGQEYDLYICKGEVWLWLNY